MRQDVTRTLALAGRDREIAPYEPFQNQFRHFEFGRIPSGWTFCGPQLHVIERLRCEGNTLTYQATAEDPKVLMTPWVMNPVTLNLVTDPDAYIIEDYPCHERDEEHLVTTEHH